MIGITTPLDYERYAVLVTPILIPGAEPVGGRPEDSALLPITRIESATSNKHSNQELDNLLGRDQHHHVRENRFRSSARIPVRHPDPGTGRGQILDIFA